MNKRIYKKSLSNDSYGLHHLMNLSERYWTLLSMDICKELGLWDRYLDKRLDYIEWLMH